MDAQDKYWLEICNHSRLAEGAGPVDESLFETIIDRLEKEWFDLVFFYFFLKK
jgi:Enhancer of polycomb-like